MAIRTKPARTNRKPASAKRTRSRVEKVEGNSRESDGYKISGKSAAHRNAEPQIEGMARLLDSGEVLIAAQFSEVVPVGRFAGVTIGPFQLAWKLGGADMSTLADVDWDSDDDLSAEQLETYNRVMNSLRGTSRILQLLINEDREIVDKAVEQFNREELEEEEKEKKNGRSKR